MGFPIPVRICDEADESHAESRRAYGHTFCKKSPSGGVCVSSAFFDLSHGHRDGVLAHEIGHLMAGQDAGEEAADRAFEEATGVRIQYRDGPHGRCLQWLPAKDRRRLLGLFDFKFSGKWSDVEEPDSDDVRFFAKSGGEKVELANLREAEAAAADDESADVWAQEGRRRLGWRPLARNPGATALVLVHPGSLDSFSFNTQDEDSAYELAGNMVGAASEHDGPVVIVDNPEGGSRIYRWFREELARNCPDATIIPFDEDTSEDDWETFLPKLRARLEAMGVTSAVVGGIWWRHDLKYGCATAVYLYLKGVLPGGATTEEDLLGCEVDDEDEDLESNPRRSPDAWKTPPPCDVEATGRPLTKAIERKLVGQPVRVHLNLHNGCYVFTHKGRVTAYARYFYLKDVLPRVGVGGYRRCHTKRVRNVHAYLEGTFVDGEPPTARGKGWRQITYNCKTNPRPCFYYVDNDECFEGAAEVRAWRVDNGDGTERCEVWVRGEPPTRKRNPPECACELPGGACTCGAVDEECARVVACGT